MQAKEVLPRQPHNGPLKYASIGFQLVALTVVLILLGLWLDAYFQSGNLYLLISIFLSVFSTMYLLITKLK
ncbi:MAG: AtpZ/AtpI family protein [Bacteroidia bacterium]